MKIDNRKKEALRISELEKALNIVRARLVFIQQILPVKNIDIDYRLDKTIGYIKDVLGDNES